MAKMTEWEELYDGIEAGRREDVREDVREDLMYTFLSETDLEVEEIYSLVFMGGRKITWQ